MAVESRSWETSLVHWATERLSFTESREQFSIADPALLREAYRHSERLTAEHSRSFHLASGLLPRRKRRAIGALYAFCRVSDEIVDRQGDQPQPALDDWRERALNPFPPSHHPVAQAWADTRRRYGIPPRYAEQLIDGVARDLSTTRHPDFHALVEYAYGVASTVGLMSMHIIGFTRPEAIASAAKLGVAMQLTNILRDVREDFDKGRLYLPQTELSVFGLTEEDIARGQLSDSWRAFMRFQIERARRLYREAVPGIALLHRDGRFSVLAAAGLYHAILDEIEARDFDVFHHRAALSGGRRLLTLARLWAVGFPSS